jgi:MFS family permease
MALAASMPVISLQTLSLFLAPVTATLGWSHSKFFLGATIGLLCTALAAPITGKLADRFGPRRVLLPGIVAYGTAVMALSTTTHSFPYYVILSILTFSIGQIHSYQLYARVVSRWVDSTRGFMLGIMMTGTAVGNVFVPFLAAYLIERFGWRNAYIGLGGFLMAVAFPVTVALVREPDDSVREASLPSAAGSSLAEAVRTPIYWILIAFTFISNFALFSVVTSLVSILMTGGLARPAAVQSLAALAISQFFGRLASGWFLDRFMSPKISLGWFLLSTLGMIILAYVHGNTEALLASALLGIAWGAEAEMNSYFVSRYFGLRHFAQINGTVYSSIAVAGALAPFVTGYVFDRAGSYYAWVLTLAILMAVSCLLLASMGPYVFLPDHRDGRSARSRSDDGGSHAVSL